VRRRSRARFRLSAQQQTDASREDGEGGERPPKLTHRGRRPSPSIASSSGEWRCPRESVRCAQRSLGMVGEPQNPEQASIRSPGAAAACGPEDRL